MNYPDLLKLVAPETLVVFAALGVLFIDLSTMRGSAWRARMQSAAGLACIGCLAAIVALFITGTTEMPSVMKGMFVVSPLTQLVKIVLLVLTIFTAIVTLESNFTDHVGEYFALLLLATAGMMFLVSTENILMIFIALELLSLSLYVMTAFNKRNIKSAEAALKYFLFGGMSAAFLLFGLSLVYGFTGELNLPAIAAKLVGKTTDPLLLAALLMVLVGFGFKVAAVPFHLWAPDAYEGAPLPSAAFIAAGSKVASFFILAKVLMTGFAGAEGSGAWRGYAQGWTPVLALLAALSVVLGNVAAIAQSSVRRLLAYSAIAHAGYMLIGVLAQRKEDGIAALLYYVTTYALTTVGAFAVVAVVQEKLGNDNFSSFAGLSRRAPGLSFCLMIFLLSLAGIPPLAGFFGKFYLFKAGLFVTDGGTRSLGLLWLVILAIAMSAVSLYYYLQVLKQVFVAAPPEGAPALRAETSTTIAVGLLALAVIVLGCAPDLLVSKLVAALQGIPL